MSDHLPECEAYRDECGGGCICHHVRACERRVLDAARDAVELKTWISVYELSDESKAYNKGIRATLAAIDALKEKP